MNCESYPTRGRLTARAVLRRAGEARARRVPRWAHYKVAQNGASEEAEQSTVLRGLRDTALLTRTYACARIALDYRVDRFLCNPADTLITYYSMPLRGIAHVLSRRVCSCSYPCCPFRSVQRNDPEPLHRPRIARRPPSPSPLFSFTHTHVPTHARIPPKQTSMGPRSAGSVVLCPSTTQECAPSVIQLRTTRSEACEGKRGPTPATLTCCWIRGRNRAFHPMEGVYICKPTSFLSNLSPAQPFTGAQ